MADYITKDGDRVDWICWRYYGRYRGGAVEAVLNANPGLAGLGLVLPGGITVSLPEIPKPVKNDGLIKLWD